LIQAILENFTVLVVKLSSMLLLVCYLLEHTGDLWLAWIRLGVISWFVFVLKKLKDECHDFFEHLLLLFRFYELAEEVFVDGFLLLVFVTKLFELCLENGKSVHKVSKELCLLRGLVTHFFDSVLSGNSDVRRFYLIFSGASFF
jgi:hypothetical protein